MLRSVTEQNSKRQAHFSLQAVAGIDESNGSAGFLLSLLVPYQATPQNRYLALFTDYGCRSSEILQEYMGVHHIVWSLVPKSQNVSNSLSPRCSALQGIWIETDVVNTHASRWSKQSPQQRLFNFSKHLRTNFQQSAFLTTWKKNPKHTIVFYVLTKLWVQTPKR